MCLTKYPLDEETRKFFNNWGQTTIADLRRKTFKASDVITNIMPAIDGTLEIFWKNGQKQAVTISEKTARVEVLGIMVPAFFLPSEEEIILYRIIHI